MPTSHAKYLTLAILGFSGFVLLIFAGALGQLFSVNGAVTRMPAYGTAATHIGLDDGRTESFSYDEQGRLISFRTIAGRTEASAYGEDGVCRDQTYLYELKDMKVWKKGSKYDAVLGALQNQLQLTVNACTVPPGTAFSCEEGCTANGDDGVTVPEAASITLVSANASRPGVLQYVFTVNAACTRVRHCVSGR